MWMQSISGQDRPQATLPDPSVLGARPSLLGSSGGRPMRGILAGSDVKQTTRMGLSGMRAPETSSKPLAPTSPLVRPVKSPIVSPVTKPSVELPKPVQKMGVAELKPVVSTLQPQEPGLDEEDEQQVPTATTTLKPITTSLTPQVRPETNVATLTPVRHMLQPAKKARGAPPPSSMGKGKDKSEEDED